MLTFLVITLIVMSVLLGIILQHLHTMAVIAELAPALTALQQKLNAIFLGVQLLKDQVAQGGQIPADAQALLDNLNSNLSALDALVNPPAPSPLP
jgi:hypothetical protein